MPEYEVMEVEKVKDMPDAKYGPAKVLKLTLKDPEGQEHEAEWFTKVATPMPGAGSKVDGEIEPSNFGPKWKPAGSGGNSGGGFKKSPAQEQRIVRQHSQEMACRIVEVLGRVPSEEEFRNLISWFEDDAFGKMKSGVNSWPMSSDVPGDTVDLEGP